MSTPWTIIQLLKKMTENYTSTIEGISAGINEKDI